MAVSLNKNRILISKLLAVGALSILIFTHPSLGEQHPFHVGIKTLGIVLTTLCVMGRIYSTAFLGGFKNQKLITHGIYSVMRNPLYFSR